MYSRRPRPRLSPPRDSRLTGRSPDRAGANARCVEIKSDKCPDAFLLDEPCVHRTLSGLLSGCAAHAGLS